MSYEPATQFTKLRSELLELPRTECLNLLRQTHFGRLAVNTSRGAPIVRPLNYVFDPRSQSVVFRTTEGTKLHGLLSAKQAAFEIDGIEPGGHTGWSVIVTSVAEEATTLADSSRRLRRGDGVA